MRFEFGTSTVPDGQKGDWRISTFEVKPEKENLELFMSNFRAIRDGHSFTCVRPGTYKRLTHKTRGVVMSNTHMERRTAYQCYTNATGRVLINGLGLGMVLEGVLSKPDVVHVKVIESEADVLALVAPHFKADLRVEFVHADAFAYKPTKDDQYDYVWHDIWDTLDEDNFPAMAKLNRKWARRTEAQGTWSRKEVRAQVRRYG